MVRFMDLQSKTLFQITQVGFNLDSINSSSYLIIHFNISDPNGYYNMTGHPDIPGGEPEGPDEPDFIPEDTESLQYQFMPWCAEDCISMLDILLFQF